jgi:hypothetical protein
MTEYIMRATILYQEVWGAGDYHWCFEKDKSTYIPKENACKRKVKNIDTGVIYDSLEEARKSTYLKSSSSVRDCCVGKKLTAAGYHWEYV